MCKIHSIDIRSVRVSDCTGLNGEGLVILQTALHKEDMESFRFLQTHFSDGSAHDIIVGFPGGQPAWFPLNHIDQVYSDLFQELFSKYQHGDQATKQLLDSICA